MDSIERSRRNLHELARLLHTGMPALSDSFFTDEESRSADDSDSSQPRSPRPPLLFLGAGVTRFLTHEVEPTEAIPPGWRCGWDELVAQVTAGLLEKGVEGAAVVEALLCDRHFSQPPEFILGFAHNLFREEFLDVLVNLFWRDRAATEEVVERIITQRGEPWRCLSQIVARSAGVFTTNYDPLLWLMITRSGWASDWQEPIVMGSAGNTPIDPMSGKKKPLVYLHGGLAPLPDRRQEAHEMLSRCIFTAQHYAAAYLSPCMVEDVGSTIAGLVRNRLLSDYPVAFIGFSFSDYLIRTLMALSQNEMLSARRYAILPTISTQDAGAEELSSQTQDQPPEKPKSEAAPVVRRGRVSSRVPGIHVMEFYEQLLGVKLIPLETLRPGASVQAANDPTTYSVAEATDFALRELLGIAQREEQEERSAMCDALLHELGFAVGNECCERSGHTAIAPQEVD